MCMCLTHFEHDKISFGKEKKTDYNYFVGGHNYRFYILGRVSFVSICKNIECNPYNLSITSLSS